MHTSRTITADYALVAALLLYTLPEWRWIWPRFVRAIRNGVVGARKRAHVYLILQVWVMTLYILTVWIAQGRSWRELWLGRVESLRFSLGCLLALIAIALFVLQARKVKKALVRPKAVARLREQLAFAGSLLPETASERYSFWLVSMSAGICEEIIFRGFLMWLISAWLGLVAAVIISSIIFGYVHIYLGIGYAPKVMLVGLGYAIVVLISGSLLPAMVIHAAMDLSSGEIGFRVTQASAALTSSPSPTS